MKIDINKKYRYRSGEPVRVICIDACELYPVIAIDEAGDPTTHTADGRCFEDEESDNDLIEVREQREFRLSVKRGQAWIYDRGDENRGWEIIRVREIID